VHAVYRWGSREGGDEEKFSHNLTFSTTTYKQTIEIANKKNINKDIGIEQININTNQFTD
jgi:hypothetical protein